MHGLNNHKAEVQRGDNFGAPRVQWTPATQCYMVRTLGDRHGDSQARDPCQGSGRASGGARREDEEAGATEALTGSRLLARMDGAARVISDA